MSLSLLISNRIARKSAKVVCCIEEKGDFITTQEMLVLRDGHSVLFVEVVGECSNDDQPAWDMA